MAERNRKTRPRRKKKKLNWFRVAVVTLGVSLAVAVVSVIAHGMRPAVSDEKAQGNGSDPVFFSTIRPASTPAPKNDLIGSDDVPKSAFDGALFVGDSLTGQLEYYVEDGAGGSTILRDAEYLTEYDYSWEAALDEFSGGSATLWYGDAPVTLSTAIQQTQARKLYIQLGKEDLMGNDVDTVVADAKSVLSELRRAYPGLEITVQSVTPMLQWIECDGLSSETIAEYNKAMKSYCKREGMGFADVAAFFTEGYLPLEYCSDPGGLCMHLNDAGCALWSSYLLGKLKPEAESTPEPTDAPDDPVSLDGVGRYAE